MKLLVNFDAFNKEQDEIIRSIFRVYAENNTFPAPDNSSIPTVEQMNKVYYKQGIPWQLQVLHHFAICRNGMYVFGLGKNILLRALESALQNHFCHRLDATTSVHEIFRSDVWALECANELTQIMYDSRWHSMREEFTNDELKEMSQNPCLFHGNWPPGGIDDEIATTLILAARITGNMDTFLKQGREDWFADALPPTDPEKGKGCYDPSQYTDKQLGDGEEKTMDFLAKVEKIGYMATMKPCDIVLKRDNKGLSIQERLAVRPYWKLVSDFGDIQDYRYKNPVTKKCSILIIVRPPCFALTTAPGFMVRKLQGPMVYRGMSLESTAMLVAKCKNPLGNPLDHNMLTEGKSIIMAVFLKLFVSHQLHGIRHMASRVAKEILTPNRFNTLERDRKCIATFSDKAYYQVRNQDFPFCRRKRTSKFNRVNRNICAPLQGVVPLYFQGNMEQACEVKLPQDRELVNFPCPAHNQCKMCGQEHNMSSSPVSICSDCSTQIWVITGKHALKGNQIKFCRGCQRFQMWASFGLRGIQICSKCHEKQKEQRRNLGKPSYEMQWNAKYHQLAQFYKKHGHLNVEYNGTLYVWKRMQKRRFVGAKGLTPLMNEQIQRLEEIDFFNKNKLTPNAIKWNSKYKELVEFYKKHGHLKVKRKEDKSLHAWMVSQRQKRKTDRQANPTIGGD